MDIVFTVVLFLPFMAILWLANQTDRRKTPEEKHPILAGLTYGLLISFYLGFAFIGLMFFLVGSIPADLSPQAAAAFSAFGSDPAGKSALARVGLGLSLPSLLALVLLLPPVRGFLARVLPIDRSRTVHAVALSYTMLVVSNLMVTLGWGLENMANSLEGSGSTSTVNLLLATWAQEMIWALTALLGVGWLARRKLGQALQRLGVTRPTLRQVGVGFGAGLLLAPAALVFEALASIAGVSVDPDVGRLTESLLGPLFQSLPGILTLGLAAALGEESIFRGALQPRFGLPATAVLFALLHSNYGLTLSTLIVLLLGIVLGLLRRRANTTTAMITHATYNIALGLLAYFQAF